MSMAAREAAGCVVLRQLQGGLQVLLIRLKNRDDPRLPKGGVEDGESYEQCAVREVEEETGYQVRLLPYEPVVVEAVKNKRLPVLHLTIRFFSPPPSTAPPTNERTVSSFPGWTGCPCRKPSAACGFRRKKRRWRNA
ncbi:NUDIX domain-containing protein [Paenibacillus sp. CC-CFT747]|nr:NUDIX domain-containing protein [Paenibacillus sp. CC-CFT747]